MSRLLFAFLILLTACEEDPIPSKAILPGDNTSLSTTEVPVIASLVTADVRTDEADRNSSFRTNINLAGSINDPIFGKSEAGFYTQLRLPTTRVHFSDSARLDSIVLCLQYFNAYGDTNTEQTWVVRELEDVMYYDSTYYSSKTFKTATTEAGHITFKPRPHSAALVDGDSGISQLRIPLSLELGNKLFHAKQPDLFDNTSFLNFFKGLYVGPATASLIGEGSIIYFNLLTGNSHLRMYYNHGGAKDSVFDFVINPDCARINHFDRDYTGISFADTANGKAYIQSMGGVKALIRMPAIQSMIDKKTVVNKAELILPAAAYDNMFPPPAALRVIRLDESGAHLFVSDELKDPVVFDGKYNATTNAYHFVVTLHVQGLLQGSIKDYGLFLVPSGEAISANRVVLNATGMKLKVTYSK